MFKNKLFAMLMIFVLVIGLFAGCAKEAEEPVAEEPKTEEPTSEEPTEEAKYEDGLYYAEEDEFSGSGWKGIIVIEVKEGKIADINWTAASKNGGADKKEASMGGKYPMVENGGAAAPWHEQAEKAESHLMETQDLEAITYTDDEGHTDAIAGVSIHVNDFYALAKKALEAGPAEMGPYKDGAYHAEESEFNHGWKGTVDITVVFGKIVAVNWNALPEEGDVDKKTASEEGTYVLAEGAVSQWYEQAMATEAYLISTQDPEQIEYKDEEGHTDAIAGVTVHVNDFYQLVNEALAGAK